MRVVWLTKGYVIVKRNQVFTADSLKNKNRASFELKQTHEQTRYILIYMHSTIRICTMDRGLLPLSVL